MMEEKYTRRNFLKKAAGLAGLTSLVGVSGCTIHNKYDFNGLIDGEKVHFYVDVDVEIDNYLFVVKKDGTEILYEDCSGNNLKIDKLRINPNTLNEEIYVNDEIGKPVLEKAQKKFDCYLNKIKKFKQNKAFKALGVDTLK